jgi:hypothetical protein
MTETHVVYIVGLGHSGSTLLTRLLGSHSQMLAVGELNVLRHRHEDFGSASPAKEIPHLGQPCSCGSASIYDCPFWQHVNDKLAQTDSLSLDTIDLYTPEVEAFRKHSHAIYRALHQTSGRPYIVDSSKELSFLLRLSNETDLKVHPIFLVRRLEGVLYSSIKKKRGWVRALARHTNTLGYIHYKLRKRDHLVVKYEEMVTSTEATLKRIWSWLNLPYEPTWSQWGELEYHILAGNRMRHSRNGQIKLDDEWQRELSTIQKLSCRVGSVMSSNQHIYQLFRGIRTTLGRRGKS